MGAVPDTNDPATRELLTRLAAGDEGGWPELVRLHHARLRRMIAIRLDARLHGRIDPSDVLQDVPDPAIKTSLKALQDIKERIKALADPPGHIAAK